MANPSPGFRSNPTHKITVEPYPGKVTVRLGDAVIASSSEALELREADYPPVLYIPFKDIRFDQLTKTETSTTCPFKGKASYWSAEADGKAAKDAMWAYEAPYDEMIRIKDHGAFYLNKVVIRSE
ncbi:DUF427 domain-containing protein [Aquamicrobium sp. LC103]|uniref:DUF427 domain-containing protein n=1 Tax=Aquamicrobium sp. LC103 TaxID=1120658 RepID=UPI00063EA2E1|nr:DUF427 domain-containing protein [Aquamicrobium sp. LC103]TKT81171.1 DUF427 domain-containing protein [Aquamicrobium sp. LC103]